MRYLIAGLFVIYSFPSFSDTGLTLEEKKEVLDSLMKEYSSQYKLCTEYIKKGADSFYVKAYCQKLIPISLKVVDVLNKMPNNQENIVDIYLPWFNKKHKNVRELLKLLDYDIPLVSTEKSNK